MSLVQEINVEAMRTAIRQFVPENVLPAIEHLYQLLDQSMKKGYELGKLDGTREAENIANVSFDNGYEYGHFDGIAEGLAGVEEIADGEWDEGYLAGVDHARRRPDLADEMVEEIIADQAQHALNGEYEVIYEHPPCEMFYIGDSGDEA